MVLCVLFLEKGKGNVVYHLPEKRVVPVEKQMNRSIFFGTGNCGQMELKFPGRKREYFERYLFTENIPPGLTVLFEFSPELPKILFKWYAPLGYTNKHTQKAMFTCQVRAHDSAAKVMTWS